MGRKKKSRGIIWGADPSNSAPQGESTHAIDLTSRTSRRQQARAHIEERRTILGECAALTPERRVLAAELARADFSARGHDPSVLSVGLLAQITELSEMKKSGARQRLIKHISTTLGDEDWEALAQLIRSIRASDSES